MALSNKVGVGFGHRVEVAAKFLALLLTSTTLVALMSSMLSLIAFPDQSLIYALFATMTFLAFSVLPYLIAITGIGGLDEYFQAFLFGGFVGQAIALASLTIFKMFEGDLNLVRAVVYVTVLCNLTGALSYSVVRYLEIRKWFKRPNPPA